MDPRFAMFVILLLSIFNMAAAVIGYMCLKSAGKEKETNAKFLIFNMVFSGLLILLSMFGIYSGFGGGKSNMISPNDPFNVRSLRD